MPDIEKNGYGIPYQLIQGGCKLLDAVSNTWLYEFEDSNGPQRYVFVSATKPEIGDKIVNGVLVPKDGYLINNDPGFQEKKNHDWDWPDRNVQH